MKTSQPFFPPLNFAFVRFSIRKTDTCIENWEGTKETEDVLH